MVRPGGVAALGVKPEPVPASAPTKIRFLPGCQPWRVRARPGEGEGQQAQMGGGFAIARFNDLGQSIVRGVGNDQISYQHISDARAHVHR